jgi:putative transposase
MQETTFLCSWVYNQCLAQRKEVWEKEQKSISCYDQINQLPSLKKTDERYQSVFSQVLQDTVKRLDKSFKNFFRRIKAGEEKAGYPRFKSARRYDSFTYPQNGFKLNGKKLSLSKIGDVKINLHRPIEGEIKTLTIRRQADGWFACFACEIEANPLPSTKCDSASLSSLGKIVGVDVGLSAGVAVSNFPENFAITSDGEFFPPIKDLRQSEKKIKRAQRKVSRRKKGSKRRRKSVWRLKRAHLRVANKRRDTHHKVARKLIEKYDVIAIEDLSIKNMVKNHHLAKSISDAGWSSFATILVAKAEDAGRRIVKVDPKFTSQVCSMCGAVGKKELSQRWHSCECGGELHRDVNAAKNILTKANITQLGGDTAFGDRVALAP